MEALIVSGAIELASRVSSSLASGGSASGTVAALMANKSLIDVASVARVEPITMVDADCVNIPEIGDVMQSLQAIFTGYYLQAVDMMGSIDGVSIASKLAPLNPNRSLGFEHMINHGRRTMAMEDYKHRLPLKKHTALMAMEADRPEKPPIGSGMQVDTKAVDSIKDAANLSVGKTYNVTIKSSNGTTATIPIAVRLMVNVLPTRMMVELFTYQDNFDMDFKERYHAWKAGRLEFVKDLILCNDLIDKRRKMGIKDASGVLASISNRESKNIVASLISGKASVATSSNIAVLSTETVAMVEQAISGQFTNSKVRKTVFENTNLMLMCVIDKAWERVTVYHRGLDTTTNLSFRDLKAASKGGPDVGDILKAYMSGTAPIQ